MNYLYRIAAIILIIAFSFTYSVNVFSELEYKNEIDVIFSILKDDPDFLPALYAVQPNYAGNGITVELLNEVIKMMINDILIQAMSEVDSGMMNTGNMSERVQKITEEIAWNMGDKYTHGGVEGFMYMALFFDAFPAEMEQYKEHFRPLYNAIIDVVKDIIVPPELTPTPLPTPKPNNNSGGGNWDEPDSTPNPSATLAPGTTPDTNTTPDPAQTTAPLITSQLPFTDLNNYKWAEKAIAVLYDMEVINGYSTDSFAPGANVTREQFAKMLVILFDIQSESDEEIEFSDVPENEWYHPYVTTLARSGVVRGISETAFGTGQNITRQDMAVMLYRIYQSKGYDTNRTADHIFEDDNQISPYAKDAVLTFKEKGIINGTPDNYFFPQNPASRAEAAQILYNCTK